MELFTCILFAGFLLGSFILFLGFLLLYKTKMQLINQRLIMMNLTLNICVNCLGTATFLGGDLFGYPHIALIYIEGFLFYWSCSTSKFTIMHLIIDRFLDVYLHLKYAVYFTKSTVVKIIICLWVMGGLSASILIIVEIHVLGTNKTTSVFMYIVISSDLTITILAICTYVYFYKQVKHMSEQDRKLTIVQFHQDETNRYSKFTIPFMIIASYLIFNVTAMTLLAISHTNRIAWSKLLLRNVALLLILIGWVCDTLLCILFRREARSVLTSLLACKNETV